MDKFEIGEIAIMNYPVNFEKPAPCLNPKPVVPQGTEVQILSNLHARELEWESGRRTSIVYLITPGNGYQYACPPNWLRKKKPPKDEETTTWDQCVWQPRKQPTEAPETIKG